MNEHEKYSEEELIEFEKISETFRDLKEKYEKEIFTQIPQIDDELMIRYRSYRKSVLMKLFNIKE